MPELPRAVMIFAAGFGTRMGAAGRLRPKPLFELAGRSLLAHALAEARAIAPERIVVNAHYRAEMIAAHLHGEAGVTVAHEYPRVLETGGGLRAARGLLPAGPVATLNPDGLWRGPAPLPLLGAAWRPREMGALLLLVPPGAAHGHRGAGDFSIDTSGRLGRGGPLVYTGAQIIDPAAVEGFGPGPFSLNLAWDALAARGRLYGAVYPGAWADTGHPAGLAAAAALLEAGPDD
jgi:MurNAc alpha-1-phosphate uridylyltransferase